MQRVILHANDGKVLTNGEIYGTIICLAEGLDGTGFYEITKDEYEETLKKQEEEIKEEQSEK